MNDRRMKLPSFIAKVRELREQNSHFRQNGMSGMEIDRKTAQKASIRKVNWFGVGYFFWFCTAAVLVGAFVTIPEMYREHPEEIPLRVFSMAFCYLQIVINFYMISIKSRLDRYPGPGKDGFIPITAPENMWQTCKHCLLKVPPRCHHCPVCDSCILKRDHHCFFLYACIGFYNQRYFIVLLFYSTLAGWYNLYVLRNYLENFYVDPFSAEFYRLIIPVAMYDLYVENISCGVFLLSLFLYCSIFSCLAVTFFFVQQILFSAMGRTSYEFAKGISKYGLGVCENLKTVFGPLGIINFLMPCPWTQSDGDGMTWKSKGI